MLNAKLRETVPETSYRKYGIGTPGTPAFGRPKFGSPGQANAGGSADMAGKASYQWTEQLLAGLNPIATLDEIDSAVPNLQAVGITFLGAFRQQDRDWEQCMAFLKIPDRWNDVDLQSPSLTHNQIQDLMTDLDDGLDMLTFMLAACAGKVVLKVDGRVASTSASLCMRYMSVSPDQVVGSNPFTTHLN
jgi:hypothetical protein